MKPSGYRAKTGGDGGVAVFLDPPYSTSGGLYAEGCDTGSVSAAVRKWCVTAPESLRIVLCGYDSEHDELLNHGWRVERGQGGGGAGYSVNRENGRRERLWMSPACLKQEALFDMREAA